MDLLTAFGSCVCDDAKAAFRVGPATIGERKLGGQHHHAPQQRGVLGSRLRHGRNMQLGNHQKMNWRPGVDIVKNENLVVFVHLAAGNGACGNFAKNAILGGVHHSTALLAFMRTMPSTIRYKNQTEISVQAIQPGTSSKNHSGAVTRYSKLAHNSVRMRQLK